MPVAGEIRTAIKWADGKAIKNEVDMQVCLFFNYCVCPCDYGPVEAVELLTLYTLSNSASGFKGPAPVGTQDRG